MDQTEAPHNTIISSNGTLGGRVSGNTMALGKLRLGDSKRASVKYRGSSLRRLLATLKNWPERQRSTGNNADRAGLSLKYQTLAQGISVRRLR